MNIICFLEGTDATLAFVVLVTCGSIYFETLITHILGTAVTIDTTSSLGIALFVNYTIHILTVVIDLTWLSTI